MIQTSNGCRVIPIIAGDNSVRRNDPFRSECAIGIYSCRRQCAEAPPTIARQPIPVVPQSPENCQRQAACRQRTKRYARISTRSPQSPYSHYHYITINFNRVFSSNVKCKQTTNRNRSKVNQLVLVSQAAIDSPGKYHQLDSSSCFYTIPACDRQTDGGQTDKRRTTAYTYGDRDVILFHICASWFQPPYRG